MVCSSIQRKLESVRSRDETWDEMQHAPFLEIASVWYFKASRMFGFVGGYIGASGYLISGPSGRGGSVTGGGAGGWELEDGPAVGGGWGFEGSAVGGGWGFEGPAVGGGWGWEAIGEERREERRADRAPQSYRANE